METILIKLLPCLMWVGLLLRLYKHWIDKDYPYSYKTEEGKTNIKRTGFSAILVGIFFIFALIIKADDRINTEDITGVITLLGWILNYIFWGWAIDSIFLSLMKRQEQKTQEMIEKK